MKFSDVMIYYDYNLTNIARALGITKQYVAIWKKKMKYLGIFSVSWK